MTLAAILEAIAGKHSVDALSRTPEPRADYRLVEIERDVDSTSDAFIEAVNLLERCLPRSFGA